MHLFWIQYCIEWHRNLEDLTYDIKYTNILEDSDNKGGYIFNGVTNDATYDAFYNLYHKKEHLLLKKLKAS